MRGLSSHYLDYKSDWDAPEEIKRDLHALSALFHVADNQFEAVFRAGVQSRETARVEVRASLDQPLNHDTLVAYLDQKFPDREPADAQTVSDLLEELKQADVTSIAQLNEALDRAVDAALQYEAEHPPGNARRFARVGIVRMAMSILSDKFITARENRFPSVESFRDRYAAYRHLLKGRG